MRCLVIGLLCLVSPAQEPVQSELVRRVEVPLRQGSLDVADLVRALAVEFEFAPDSLPLPDLRVDLRGGRGALLLVGARKLLLDTVRLRRDLDADRLEVVIDRVRAREVRRDLRGALAKLAGRLAGGDATERRYLLDRPADLDAGRPLVVLVHGVDADAGAFDDLREFLAAPPRACQLATFSFPNDEAIETVAAEFAKALRALAPQPVAVVAHSLGGLVARAAVEDPALDPGNVRTLVLLGTPNGGSSLAGLRVALEVGDALAGADGAESFGRELVDAIVDRWRDGLGEAGGDLWPGSVCLSRLAARERNPAVSYHSVLGTRAPLAPAQWERVRRVLAARLDANRLTRAVEPRLRRWLDGLDEIVDGRGDGAVSVGRGSLPGVEPVLVPLDHLALIRRRGLLGRVDGEHPVFALVAAWVAAR